MGKWNPSWQKVKNKQIQEKMYCYKLRRGMRCAMCGYHKNSAALTWHHLDPSQKEFEIASYARKRRNWKRIEKELKKCVLICQNCLAEVHYPHANIEKVK